MAGSDQRSDEEIVGAIRAGDRELYALIMARYQERLLRYAKVLVRDDDRAADVVQEAFIKTFLNLQGFNIHKKFSSWIYRIAHNEAMNHLTKHRTEVALPDNVDFPSDEDLEERLGRQEMIARVEKCLAQLPLIYSEPLALFFLDERSYEEISDILRLPMGTVATRIRRAKAYMKVICQKI
jgi:RNA polymerase sigma-70 factor (ECF subfamily)